MSGKPGKRGEAAKAAADGDDSEVTRRLGELKSKVARAAELIAGLREANHTLKGELAELSRQVGSLEAAPSTKADVRAEPGKEDAPGSKAGERERQHLELLLQERKAIRKKIQKLLERVGRLES